MRNGGACRVHVIDEKVSNVEKGVCRHIIDIDVPMKPVCTAELGLCSSVFRLNSSPGIVKFHSVYHSGGPGYITISIPGSWFTIEQ